MPVCWQVMDAFAMERRNLGSRGHIGRIRRSICELLTTEMQINALRYSDDRREILGSMWTKNYGPAMLRQLSLFRSKCDRDTHLSVIYLQFEARSSKFLQNLEPVGVVICPHCSTFV